MVFHREMDAIEKAHFLHLIRWQCLREETRIVYDKEDLSLGSILNEL